MHLCVITSVVLFLGTCQAAPLPIRCVDGVASVLFVRAGDAYTEAIVVVYDGRKRYVCHLNMPDARSLYLNGYPATEKQLEDLRLKCYRLNVSTDYLPCRVLYRNGDVIRLDFALKD